MKSGAATMLILLFGAATGVTASVNAKGSVDRVRLGARTLEIPQQYFGADDRMPFWLRWWPGLDNGSREILLSIPSKEAAQAIEGYQPLDGAYDDTLRLRLSAVSSEERARYLEPKRFADILDETRRDAPPIVESDPLTGLTRVYRSVEYPNSWESFKRPVRDLSDVNEAWLGHCIRSKSPLTASGYLALCKSTVVVDGVAVTFTTSDQNIGKVDLIRSYLSTIVQGWMNAAE